MAGQVFILKVMVELTSLSQEALHARVILRDHVELTTPEEMAHARPIRQATVAGMAQGLAELQDAGLVVEAYTGHWRLVEQS